MTRCRLVFLKPVVALKRRAQRGDLFGRKGNISRANRETGRAVAEDCFQAGGGGFHLGGRFWAQGQGGARARAGAPQGRRQQNPDQMVGEIEVPHDRGKYSFRIRKNQ
ncbi:MAG: hypothetical protein COV76_01895 [Candidatus Omnitrophica bacterium CG11_big_fil_rev_8_21_14_0_20_64_10]|nr:MAG: hypothetical protein COV76_01895 [Candidatus Omnitrophica bacterium CG11_big_fil_rev_8_21_14_0_20_64_10]